MDITFKELLLKLNYNEYKYILGLISAKNEKLTKFETENRKYYLIIISIKEYLEKCYNTNTEVDIKYIINFIERKLKNE